MAHLRFKRINMSTTGTLVPEVLIFILFFEESMYVHKGVDYDTLN